MNKLNIRKHHIIKKDIFKVTSSLAFLQCVLHSFLNIRNIWLFLMDYIMKWQKIILNHKVKRK